MTQPMQGSAPANSQTDVSPRICCVGGGKGGTGKSVLALNLARTLAQEGLQVVLADMDLGGANLHILSGLRQTSASHSRVVASRLAAIGDGRPD